MHNYNVDRKYQYGCRLGNWSEEQDLDDHKMKEYLKKKEQQKLVCVDREDRLKRSQAPVELSFSEDGLLHYGFVVQIFSDYMNGIVATNPAERIPGNEESYAVTVTSDERVALRNSFHILRYEKDPLHNDDIIRYGQNFRLALSTSPDKTLLLCSSAITPQRCAKFSRKQEVCASIDTSVNAVWSLEYDDPKLRYEMKGKPVRSGEPVLIKHVPTSQWLASDNIPYANEFAGHEYEVFCHSFSSHNKTQNLIAEKVGRKTIETPMRNQAHQNLFRILTALNPPVNTNNTLRQTATISQSAFLSSSTKTANALSQQDLLFKVRRALMNQAGPYALNQFAIHLAKTDSKNSKVLDDQTFRQAVILFGITLTEIDIADLIRAYGSVSGNVNYVAFLQELKGSLSPQRRALVEAAYDSVDEKLGGNVSLNGILNAFAKFKHPDVVKRYCTEKEALSEFELSWGNANRHSKISREQFISYYGDYSACVEKEDYFEAVLKNVWGLSS